MVVLNPLTSVHWEVTQEETSESHAEPLVQVYTGKIQEENQEKD